MVAPRIDIPGTDRRACSRPAYLGPVERAVHAGEATLADHTYDALGRRIRSVDTGRLLTQHYYYDLQNVIAENDPDEPAPLLRYFIHGSQYIDERVLMHKIKGDDDFYYFTRELYSVEGLVNNRGHEVERYTYDAYGKPTITAVRVEDVNYNGTVDGGDLAQILGYLGSDPCTQAAPIYDVNGDGAINSKDLNAVNKAYGSALQTIPESGIGNPYAFTGRRMDFFDHQGSTQIPQLMLYHSRGREYDPHHGRFLQRDPAGYVDGMSLYEYAVSRPGVFMDPLGLKKMTVKECQNFWKHFVDDFITSRQDRDKLIKRIDAEVAAVIKARNDLETGKITRPQFDSIVAGAHRVFNRDQINVWKLKRILQNDFEMARLANFMVHVGCKCAAARKVTFSLSISDALLDVINNIPSDPRGPGAIPGRIAAKEKQNENVQKAVKSFLFKGLYLTLSNECCPNDPNLFGQRWRKADDLYVTPPTVDNLGPNNSFKKAFED